MARLTCMAFCVAIDLVGDDASVFLRSEIIAEFFGYTRQKRVIQREYVLGHEGAQRVSTTDLRRSEAGPFR